MELLNKHLENLVTQKALALFFFNFNTYPIVKEMEAEDSGFQHAWNTLVENSKAEHDKNGGMWIIQYTEIYTLFVQKLTYKAQALLMEKVLNYYGEEARKAIEFSIEMEEIALKRRKEFNKKQ